ncbi:MAG: tetratricopeptide repeat protein [Acidobacteria bacterium]|nr:tetratricopeptide repeat protein [Acidobacteriota bacterium]
MDTGLETRRAAAAPALALLLLAVVALQAGCRPDAGPGGGAQAVATPGATPGAAAPADLATLGAEIERLEREAERNPADEATRDELARVYVRRGNARRGAGQTREALADYQRALRLDPDNDEAQAGAADSAEQLGEAGQEDENGAPVPPPITPNVSDEDAKPTPTPKKP